MVTLLPSWSVLSELVEPRAVRVAPATSLSIVVARVISFGHVVSEDKLF